MHPATDREGPGGGGAHPSRLPPLGYRACRASSTTKAATSSSSASLSGPPASADQGVIIVAGIVYMAYGEINMTTVRSALR